LSLSLSCLLLLRVPYCEKSEWEVVHPESGPTNMDVARWWIRDFVNKADREWLERFGSPNPRRAYTNRTVMEQKMRQSPQRAVVLMHTAPGIDNPEAVNTVTGLMWALRCAGKGEVGRS
ncbi:MAG: hypothetical protein AAFY15_16410, partial [Cyanobacteria bacterium J06648_11]